MIDEIQKELFALQDTAYRDFQAKLIPNLENGSMIGVRTPALRKLAKQMARREDIGVFLETLPHTYFDENQLHAFIISERKDFAQCVTELAAFLPFIDNWATCDQKAATIISGLSQIDSGKAQQLAADLKKKLATGGSFRDDEILIQGDRRRDVIETLRFLGFKTNNCP